MNKTYIWLALFIGGLVLFAFASPEMALALDFENKAKSITSHIINVIFPILSIFGLLYAAALGISGDGDSKRKVIAVLLCSLIGFIAPAIIEWLKAASGS